MDANSVNPWVALAYLIAGVCFILALRGLSSPVSSRRGNRFGLAGMAIAVVTTLVTHVPSIKIFPTPGSPAYDTSVLDFTAIPEILIALVFGVPIGLFITRRIAMTAIPPPHYGLQPLERGGGGEGGV